MLIALGVRYKLEKTAWFRHLFRTRFQPPTRTDMEMKQTLHLDAPPKYEVAIHMPKPIAELNGIANTVDDAVENSVSLRASNSLCSENIGEEPGENDGHLPAEQSHVFIMDGLANKQSGRRTTNRECAYKRYICNFTKLHRTIS